MNATSRPIARGPVCVPASSVTAFTMVPVTRLPALGPRGEGWVAIRFLLLGFVLGASGIGALRERPTALLAGVLSLQARRGQVWPAARRPGYDAHRRRTRRPVPWLY